MTMHTPDERHCQSSVLKIYVMTMHRRHHELLMNDLQVTVEAPGHHLDIPNSKGTHITSADALIAKNMGMAPEISPLAT